MAVLQETYNHEFIDSLSLSEQYLYYMRAVEDKRKTLYYQNPDIDKSSKQPIPYKPVFVFSDVTFM
jgi:hypothetical protein